MCGIIGYLGHRKKEINTQDLMESIKHRGPDESGEFQSENVFIGHKRLSIVGLTDGKQPFIIEEHVLVFNGEIYNYQKLKNELGLLGINCFTESDTEVLLRLYLHYGESFVDLIDGMFAFFIYNKKTHNAIYARDNLGIKPLYVWENGEELAFSSEALPLIKLQQKLESENFKISNDALKHYLKHGHIGDLQITDQIHVVPKGQMFKWSEGKSQKIREIDFSCEIVSDNIKDELKKEIEQQLHADVDVGVFLSGGIDSSLITAIASDCNKKIRTFSIIFEGQKGIDESEYSHEVANKFNTIHTEFVFNETALLSYIPELIKCNDLPICDPAMLPMLLLCKNTKEDIKVVLSGDGGDELFGGYTHYRIKKYKRFFKVISFFMTPLIFIKRIRSLKVTIDKLIESITHYDFPNYDIYNNLDYRLLRKTDLTSMYYGLEVRVPFLSKRVMALSRKKNYWKYVGLFYGKKPLRKLVNDLVSSSIAYKKKQGFRIPLQKWISEGDLGVVITHSIREEMIIPEEVIESDFVFKMLKNKEAFYQEIFSIYLLNEWLKKLKNK